MDVVYDVKAEAKKQYLNYFKVWFIILGILVVCALVKLVGGLLKGDAIERTNMEAPAERVYDKADVLSDAEEEKLRELIAKYEPQIGCDIVLMTIEQPVEGSEAQQQYGYRYTDWELNMRDIADDFFDYEGYGYDNVNYSGALILDNWYKGQGGTWLSTTGKVYEKFGDYEINQVLDEIYYAIDGGSSAYKAYKKGIEELVAQMDGDTALLRGVSMGGFVIAAIIIPILVAAIFIAAKMKVKEGVVTTTSNTYVDGNARVNGQRDDFIRKHVSTRVIQTSSSSGGSRSGGSSGHGGSHRSSSGRSHGGGGRRR